MAPLLVFGAHLLASRVLDGYRRFPLLDVPMHLAGGMAMGLFLGCLLTALEARKVLEPSTGALRGLLIFSLVSTSAVVWEFLEFLADVTFRTGAQKSLADTMGDLACGMTGGCLYLVARAARRRARVLKDH